MAELFTVSIVTAGKRGITRVDRETRDFKKNSQILTCRLPTPGSPRLSGRMTTRARQDSSETIAAMLPSASKRSSGASTRLWSRVDLGRVTPRRSWRLSVAGLHLGRMGFDAVRWALLCHSVTTWDATISGTAYRDHGETAAERPRRRHSHARRLVLYTGT